MGILLDEARHAVRHLLRRPAFAVVLIVILMIGIGPTIAIFTVANGLLLRPLPYAEPERLGLVRIDLSGLTAHPGIAQAEVLDLRADMTRAQQVEAINRDFMATLGAADDMVSVRATSVTRGLFGMLGTSLSAGRSFGPEVEDEHVVVISHELWTSRFAADPDVIGSAMMLNGGEQTVIGVLPEGFQLLLGPGGGVSPDVDVWFPLDLDPESRNFWGFRTLIRLAPEASFAEARAEIAALGEAMVADHPATYENAGIRFDLHPLHQDLVAPVRPALLVLVGAVGLVLLIACNNAAGLLLASTVTRAKELAVRQALGAHRRRVLTQVFLESLILATIAGALGVAAGNLGLRALLSFQPGDLPRVQEMVIDGNVLAFAVGVTSLACFLFGLLPAWYATRAEAADVLRRGGQGSLVRARSRNSLVIAQVAFSVMLLVGAGLLIRTLQQLHDVDLGFEPANVLSLRVPLDRRTIEGEQRWTVFEQVQAEVAAIPGVTAVGGMQYTPLDGRGFRSSFSPDVDSDDEWNGTTANYRWALPGTVETLGARMVAGRDLTAADLHENRPVVVIDRTLAELAWPDEPAVGQWMRLMVESPNLDPVVEVVGVIEHPRIVDGRNVVMPEIWVPYSAVPAREMSLLVRTEGDPAALTAGVRGAIARAGTGQPVHTVQTLDALLATARADARFIFLLMSALSSVALILSAAGIYSVLAYLVRQRRHETGVRMALGAEGRDILRLNLDMGLRLGVVGVGLGLAGAAALGGWLEGVLFNVAPRDPLTLLGVALLVLVSVGLAALLPASRAARQDPARALRA